jgi:16S rRNA (guanine1207-N2)-methyltransferase
MKQGERLDGGCPLSNNDGHYFSPHPASASHPREFATVLRGERLTFTTDAGVFSREGIDRGTRLLLKALTLPVDARRLVDLGCGYGPIGIVMAKLAREAEVILIDPNGRACELAKKNAARNGLANITVMQGQGLAGVTGSLDLIAVNPPIRAGKKVVYGLMAESAARLANGGELWTVAMTSQGAKSLAKELAGLFANVDEMEKGGGFRVYRARTGSA